MSTYVKPGVYFKECDYSVYTGGEVPVRYGPAALGNKLVKAARQAFKERNKEFRYLIPRNNLITEQFVGVNKLDEVIKVVLRVLHEEGIDCKFYSNEAYDSFSIIIDGVIINITPKWWDNEI